MRDTRLAPAGDIVRMTDAHLPEVLAIERSSYEKPWAEDAFVHELHGNPFSRPVVALTPEGAPRVAGYCVYWVVFEHAQIQNLAVHPVHRRSGFGRRLLLHAISDARGAGADSVDLEVRSSNLAASSLYASLGFEIVGRREAHYSRPVEDALRLRLLLAETG